MTTIVGFANPFEFAFCWSEAQRFGWTIESDRVEPPHHFWCAEQAQPLSYVTHNGRTLIVPVSLFHPFLRVCGHMTMELAKEHRRFFVHAQGA